LIKVTINNPFLQSIKKHFEIVKRLLFCQKKEKEKEKEKEKKKKNEVKKLLKLFK